MEVIINSYQLIYIVNSALEEEQSKNLNQKIQDVLVKSGAEVKNMLVMGRKRFAYPIKKKKEGIYNVLSFKSNSQALPEIEKTLKLAEDILRYHIIRLRKKEKEEKNV